MKLPKSVTICEVGTRDGFQIEPEFIPIEQKMELGVTHIDASIGGLGGCPFAPGASGNGCTEDLVHCLGAMGVETGIDLDALIEASKRVQAIVGRALPGQIVKAGKWTRRYHLPDGVRERIPARA